MKKSIWKDGAILPEFKSLSGDVKTDVLIIGGGLCGILCGYLLKNAGVDYLIVEGGRIASSVTGNTTAKITFQHGLIYKKLIDSYGKEKAGMYLRANKSAFEKYAELCKNIDCNFEVRDAYTYSVSDREKLEAEVRAVNSLGFDAEFVQNLELPFKTLGAVRFKNQAQFHPLKFISHIAEGINICENTFVRELTPNGAVTDKGKIKADKIIVATHFPFINKHGSYFLKLYQHRSYAAAFEGAVNLKGMYVDEDKKGMSFRSFNNMLIAVGGGHRTGKQSGAWREVSDTVKKYYPNAKAKYEWAAQDCMSLDSIPYIGKYSAGITDMYVASGFNKWGITSSMAAAMILSDMVLDKKNEFAEVFSPQRGMLKPQLLVNGFEAALNLLTPTVKRCPHLGCALKWNKAEHSWDCPCHGSRFEENGKLINNPATGDANIN